MIHNSMGNYVSSIGLVAAALNSHARRQKGHFWSLPTVDSHLFMHCKWKEWLHLPHTTALSSPGNLASGGQPSKGALHMPQTSSPAIFSSQTPSQNLRESFLALTSAAEGFSLRYYSAACLVWAIHCVWQLSDFCLLLVFSGILEFQRDQSISLFQSRRIFRMIHRLPKSS